MFSHVAVRGGLSALLAASLLAAPVPPSLAASGGTVSAVASVTQKRVAADIFSCRYHPALPWCKKK